MSSLRRSMQSYPLAYFTILACLFGWALYIAAGLGADLTPLNLPIGPIIAAAVVCAGMGRQGMREWGRRLASFRTSAGWYAVALFAPIGVITAAVLANAAFGAPLPTAAQLAGWTGLPLVFLFMIIFIGVGEEAGWTAFAAPQLLSRQTFIRAWLILSAIRIFWHLPLMLTGDLTWVLGIGGNAAFQLLLLWIFLRSGGVWVLAAVWHAMLNTLGGEFFFQMVQGADQARLGILMTAAYAVLALGVYLADRHRLVTGARVTPATT